MTSTATVPDSTTSNATTTAATSNLFGTDSEEEKEEENENLDGVTYGMQASATAADAADGTEEDINNDALLDQIVPTESVSDRFRNALARVQVDSSRDIAAWSALVTEAQLLARDWSDGHLKLLESCYGALLKVFPYSARHWANVAEFLLVLADPENFSVSIHMKQRANRKLDQLFRDSLGVGVTVADDEDKGANAVRNGPCSSSIDLWKLYIHKRLLDARAIATGGDTMMGAADDSPIIRDAHFKAIDLALEVAGFVSGANELWTMYITNIQLHINKATEANNTQDEQRLKVLLRSIFQRAIGIPMQNLDDFWREYEVFEQRQSEALAQALLAEHLPRLQHAKQVYLERKQYMIDLKMTRLAVPPENTELEKALLLRWKKRCAYERTNPERLTSSGLGQRIRQAYKDYVCVLTRHPEAWHEWASWENGGSSGGGFLAANKVYELAEQNMPDSALIASAHAELYESVGENDRAIQCYEEFIQRHPCSLGFILLQKLVRRTKGIDAARKIFTRARQCLVNADKEKSTNVKDNPLQSGTVPENETLADDTEKIVVNSMKQSNIKKDNESKKGTMTWHVFAAHAEMELRMNGFREVAKRVFELGLSKYSSFLSCPPYIVVYAKLLIELGDEDNFRLLLERAISACEEASLPIESQRILWNLLVEFEYKISRTSGDPTVIKLLEARRERALGGGSSELLPKILDDELTKSDGNNAGLISGGLGRLLERYELVGLVDTVDATYEEEKEEIGGGSSDTSFAKRLHGILSLPATIAAVGMSTVYDRSKAARERLNAGVATQQLQQQQLQDSVPEWLRSLIDVLPQATRLKIARPPPHMIEMALASLKNGKLPEKPVFAAPPMSGIVKESNGGNETVISTSKRKRENVDGDSSDEEGASGAGHGSLFRMRQQARQTT